MDNEKTEKKPGIFGKIGALWKSGTKGKMICLRSMAMVLLLLTQGACSKSSGGEGGGDWKYTDEYFFRVFGGVKEDEGVIYKHFPRNITMLGMSVPDSNFSNVKVLQATKKGNLVTTDDSDRIVWVEAKRRYEDDEKLEQGYYIRRGSMEYTTAFGAEKTVARYVEVTDKGILAKIQKQIEEKKAAAEKAKLEAEGQPFEVDAPIKSLCGFSIGATPSSVQSLFKGELEQSFESDEPGGELGTPFRHFDYANVDFQPDPRSGGQHLYWVKLSVKDDSAIEDWEDEDYSQEIEAIVAMLEKKFDIKFKKYCCADGAKEMKEDGEVYHTHTPEKISYCEWQTEGGEDSVSQRMLVMNTFYDGFCLILKSDFISKKEEEALKKKQEPPKLSADEGADLL